jgi:biopolymer transport protein ExbB
MLSGISGFFYLQAQQKAPAVAPAAPATKPATPPAGAQPVATPAATAPGTPAAAATPAPTAAANTLSEAGRWHFGSDPTVWVMIFIFNLALFVVLERIYVLRKVRGDGAGLVTFLTEALHRGDAADKVAATAAESKYGLEGRVAAVSLKGWEKGEHAMKEYAEASLIAERRSLEKRLVILSTLGNNTPFIGLLGTVLGIMKAFRDLAEMGDSGPAVVMRGISEALIATAMGLAVAIPVVIAYNALARMVQDKISQAEEVATLIRAIRLNK